MTLPAGPPSADLSVADAPRGRAGRVPLNLALFLAACAAVCGVIGSVTPFPEVPGIFPKWEYFSAHRAEYDLLFIGSSRVYHQFMPQEFDAAAAESGVKTKSFNFGYDGMWPPESFYLLRRLLELKPPRLKWVFIDLMDINSALDERNNSTLRMAYWHDWRHTRMAMDDIAASTRNPVARREMTLQHALLCCDEMLNRGAGAALLERALAPKNGRRRPYTWEESAGFEVGPPRALQGAARQEFLSNVAHLKRKLPFQPIRPVFLHALDAIVADVRRAGAQPIFVLAPTVNPRENFSGLPNGVPVFRLNDPSEHPELFDPDLHYDAWHLNGQGAVKFTEIVTRNFLHMQESAR